MFIDRVHMTYYSTMSVNAVQEKEKTTAAPKTKKNTQKTYSLLGGSQMVTERGDFKIITETVQKVYGRCQRQYSTKKKKINKKEEYGGGEERNTDAGGLADGKGNSSAAKSDKTVKYEERTRDSCQN